MFERVYLGAAARREHAKIERVISTLFHHYADAPDRLPPAVDGEEDDVARRVTDYVAGMTDRFCIRTFEALAVPDGFAV
jgi:dGTPase